MEERSKGHQALVPGFIICKFFLGAAKAGNHFQRIIHHPNGRIEWLSSSLPSTLAEVFDGSIPFGIGKLNLSHGLEGWRWLFLVDGAPSCPETVGWLTETERELSAFRLKGQASQGSWIGGLSAQLFTVSDRFNARSLYPMYCMAIAAIAFLVQDLLPHNAYVSRYVLLSRGSGDCNERIVAGPGQIIGVWIYKADEVPGYKTDHLTNFGILLFDTVVVLILRIVYVRRNSQLHEHARKWVL
ncbi:hypothetical protein BU17DRAFT_64620 [Hysterangium stoloniferum]|nr:hypothetical protein BU17DRAFT_64620 [Hysterangium stoloniferum]